MKEHECCRKNAEVIFNGMLRSARNPIECAFGRMKARWGILTKKNDFEVRIISVIKNLILVLAKNNVTLVSPIKGGGLFAQKS